jgi:hypothetical protein
MQKMLAKAFFGFGNHGKSNFSKLIAKPARPWVTERREVGKPKRRRKGALPRKIFRPA